MKTNLGLLMSHLSSYILNYCHTVRTMNITRNTLVESKLMNH